MIAALKTAFTNLFSPPLTHGYPAVPLPKPEHWRGLIEYNKDFCIFCDKCEKTCPPGAILFSWALDGSKTYHYNPYLCIYCGDCVRECPKTGQALQQSQTKATPALKADMPNEKWDALELNVKESKEVYKAHKVAQKKAKETPSD